MRFTQRVGAPDPRSYQSLRWPLSFQSQPHCNSIFLMFGHLLPDFHSSTDWSFVPWSLACLPKLCNASYYGRVSPQGQSLPRMASCYVWQLPGTFTQTVRSTDRRDAFPVKPPMTFCTELEKIILKFNGNTKVPGLPKQILREKNKAGRITLADFRQTAKL